ncbi:MAG: pyrroline-5-carboxylate reductase [Bacteroidaceae bacterium]|nr:pyrroline-5-carboxylate reductase [Bacteroidaceae bacterium]
MKITIIGAGNMGSAIARGLAQGNLIKAKDITVSNPSNGKLETLKTAFPDIVTTNDNEKAVENADIVILAVKPWLVAKVVPSLKLKCSQIFVSLAAGITTEQLTEYVNPRIPIARMIPNTAIAELSSMTLISTRDMTKEQEQLLLNIFNEMGMTLIIDESKMAAATALTSCGIAYVLKYVQAAMQAGIEMGITQKESMTMVAQSLEGAAKILLNNNTHPSIEIDKVTTPGGLTIKGINELEHNGFTSAIIKAIKASL